MKRALVLSGGGSRGPYQIGAIKRLMEQGYRYDLITGVSVGALIGAWIAQFDKDRQPEAVDLLWRNIFSTVKTEDIWRWWRPFPFLKWLHALWRPSFWDSSPLEKLVEETLEPVQVAQSDVELRVGAVNLNTGFYETFTDQDPDITRAVIASAAQPAFFKPVEIKGSIYLDGGLKNVSPLAEAIDAGATHIDLILLDRGEGGAWRPEKVRAFPGMVLRVLSIFLDEVTEGDLREARLVNRLVQAGAGEPWQRLISLRVLRPTDPFNTDAMEFDPVDALRLYEQGYQDAGEPWA